MAQKKSRQTFQKLKREQAVKERRARKRERREAARLDKTMGAPAAEPVEGEEGVNPAPPV
jgi:hypothetical protein